MDTTTAKGFTPRIYQQHMHEHFMSIARPAAWADMGMGKTVATLNTLQSLVICGEQKPTLVLAPLRVAQNTWPDEIEKWDHLTHLEASAIIGDEKQRLAALNNKTANVFTTNYENLPWLVEKCGKKWPFGTIVADEATKLKSFRLKGGGTRSTALAKVAHKYAERFIELTGTPAPNGLIDIWPQMWFLDRGERLGSTMTAFKERWFHPDPSGFGVVPHAHASAEIQAKLKDICLTVKAADYLDLPPLVKNVIKVQIPSRARALYEDMEKTFFTQLEEFGVEAESSAIRSMKLLQLANGAMYVDDKQTWRETHDEKIRALGELIESANGAPVLVAYHFKSDLQRLQLFFPKGRALDTDPNTIRDWNAGRIPILFAHPASAGHGLNLQQGGNIIVFFALNWNLEEHLQIIERIGPTRQFQAGLNRPCFVFYLVAEDTIDERVMERIETKASVQDILTNAMKRRNK